jgi:hypothetical protein
MLKSELIDLSRRDTKTVYVQSTICVRVCTAWHETHNPGPDAYPHTVTSLHSHTRLQTMLRLTCNNQGVTLDGSVTCWLAWLVLSRGPKARICTISHMRARMLWHETHHPGPNAYPHTATILIQVFILIQDMRRCWDSRSKYTCNKRCYRCTCAGNMLQIWYTVTAAGADASCIYLEFFSFSLLCTTEYTHTVTDIELRFLPKTHVKLDHLVLNAKHSKQNFLYALFPAEVAKLFYCSKSFLIL